MSRERTRPPGGRPGGPHGEPRRGHAPFFFVEPGSLPASDGPVIIEGVDARHLAVVRRAVPGDRIVVSDGKGGIVDAELVSVTPVRVEAAVVSAIVVPAPRPAVEIYQGLAKGDKVDAVIRRLVELGVDAVGVFEAGRSVAQWDGARAAAATSRWGLIAREAAKQSHRAWMPEIRGPMRLAEAAGRAEAGTGLGLVAHPGAVQPLRAALPGPGLETPGAGPPDRIWLVVGPEGGLTDAEVEAFVSVGAVPVSLGEQILRTETASVVAAALVLYSFGRLG